MSVHLRKRRGITAETAIALGEYFGQMPMFWLNVQKLHELSKELISRGDEIRARVRRRAEPAAAV